ncbi:grxC [Symbiodinium sp. CCMP2592]|nr:grxC [Symbiodinium sp. CCMP2592]
MASRDATAIVQMKAGWQQQADLVIWNPCGYRPEQYVVSETVGPTDDFRMRLVVYPRGRYHYKDDCDLLSAFLEIVPPVCLEGCRWRCEDIHFELTALKEDDADVKPWKTGTFTFSDSCRFAGLCDICDMDEVAEEGIWLNRLRELRVRGQATCAPPSPKGRLEQVELILRDLETFIPNPEDPRSHAPAPVLSRQAGPPNAFRIQLRVHPIVPERSGCLCVFIYLMPGPMQDIGSEWIVQDAKCEVTVYQEGADWVVKEAATFCFTDEESGNGWSELWPRPLQDLASWVGLGRLVVQASVEFPLPTDALKDLYQGLDFSQEVTQVTVRLAEGPPLFFDKRVLMACSEYFRDMLEEPRFREGCNNEIDLSCDPQADHRAVSAIFRYMTSGTFFANGDFTFALSIRKLADQYRLTGLVEKAETELGSLLSENNVLMFLSHVFGTGCRLEQLCVQMIMNNGCEVLVLQEEQLTQMVDAHPELAKKLMRALLAARSQLRWPEDCLDSDSLEEEMKSASASR